MSVHTKTDTRRIPVANNLQHINRKMPKKDKDKAGTNKKRHSKVGNGKDKGEDVCVGQCGKLFSCDNDSMVACDRCSQFTCIECLGMSSSSLGSRCVPWLGEGLRMPSPNYPVLCFPLPYRVAPVFV